MQDEELAGLEDRGVPGDGDDRLDHDLGEVLVARAQEQPAGRDDAQQPAVAVRDVEIDDPPRRLLFEDQVQGLGHRQVRVQLDSNIRSNSAKYAW